MELRIGFALQSTMTLAEGHRALKQRSFLFKWIIPAPQVDDLHLFGREIRGRKFAFACDTFDWKDAAVAWLIDDAFVWTFRVDLVIRGGPSQQAEHISAGSLHSGVAERDRNSDRMLC